MKYEKELDYSQMMTALNELTKDKSYIKMSYIGNSILYRPIPVLTIGEQSAKKSVLYVATHHATESICTLLLLKFLSEFISLHEKGQKACGINLKFMLDARKQNAKNANVFGFDNIRAAMKISSKFLSQRQTDITVYMESVPGKTITNNNLGWETWCSFVVVYNAEFPGYNLNPSGRVRGREYRHRDRTCLNVVQLDGHVTTRHHTDFKSICK